MPTITQAAPGIGFKNLAFSGVWTTEDFDHNAALDWDVIGLPDGLSLTSNNNSYTASARNISAVNTGTSTITTATAHKLQAGDKVQFTSTGSLPSGLSAFTDYYVSAAGLTSTDFRVSATLGGSVQALASAGSGTRTFTWYPETGHNWRALLTGTPTTGGIYEITLVAVGTASGVPTTVRFDATIIIEGDGYLAWYHLDTSVDPAQPRQAIDLQYNLRTQTFTSASFNVTNGLDLWFGRTSPRLHTIISRNGTKTLADSTPLLPDPAPTDVSLIVRPVNQHDGPELIRAIAGGDEALGIDGFATRDVVYFDLTATGRVLEQIFHVLNLPAAADAASTSLQGALQIAFTLDGTLHLTPPLTVNIRQPYNR